MRDDQGSSARIDSEELLAEAGWVRRLARGLVRDAGAADDVVQETWLAALRRPRASDVPLRPWLARVVANFARDKTRADASRERREFLSARSEREPSASDMAERLEAHRLLIEALAALPEPYRTTVSLRYLDGLSASSIARRQKIPAGTVRWRLKHGLDELRARLDHRFGGERRAWCLALLPLIRRPPLLQVAASSASAVLHGVMVMNTMARIGIAAAVLVTAGVGVWIAVDRGPSPIAAAPPPVPPEAAARLSPPPAEDPARDLASTPAVGERASVNSPAPRPELPAAENPSQARLEGRFVDSNMRPIASVRLLATSGGVESSADSGADGRISLAFELAKESQRATIEASASGRATLFSSANLRRGETVWLGDLVLAPGGAIEGLVRGPDGRPVDGANILAAKPDLVSDPEDGRRFGPSTGPCPHATSSGSGTFRVDGVTAGAPVRVWVGHAGMRWAFSAPIEITPGEVKGGLEISLEALAKEDVIEGIVLAPDGSPIPSAEIACMYRARSQSGSSRAYAGRDGRFQIRLIQVVPYDLRVEDPQNRWPAISALQVAPGTRDLELRFSPARTIELVVREKDGAPIERYRVSLQTVDRFRMLATAAEEDHPEGKSPLVLPSEPFRFRVVARGHAQSDLEPIDPAAMPASFEVRLERQAGLRGRVTAHGQPVEGAKVELHKVADEKTTIEHNQFLSRLFPNVEDSSRSAADGAFQLDPREKTTLSIVCTADGYALAELSPLDVDPRVGMDGLEIALVKGGSIEGRVILPPGRDPAGIIVAIDRYDARPFTQRVGPDGRFSFAGLTPGPWRVKRVKAEVVRGEDGGTAIGGSNGRQEYPSDCVVGDGEVTHRDLDLSDDRPCILVGLVTENGRAATGWTATVWPAANVSTGELPGGAVDSEGRLRVEIREPGEYFVQLRTPAEGGGQGMFRTPPAMIVRGENSLPLDLRLGRIEGQGAATSESNQITYGWRDPSGLTYYATIEIDASGKFELPHVPAGRGEIERLVRGDDKAWRSVGKKSVEVPAGGIAVVEAP